VAKDINRLPSKQNLEEDFKDRNTKRKLSEEGVVSNLI